ncbi:hypothetical protein ACQKCU_23715 [Heyndrickxia sporothermodurans]
MSTNDEILLMMPAILEEEQEYGPSAGSMLLDQVPVSHTTLTDFASKFSGYDLDTIEVHVKGAAQSGGVTKLFVGLSGEAGVKLVLKKKNDK